MHNAEVAHQCRNMRPLCLQNRAQESPRDDLVSRSTGQLHLDTGSYRRHAHRMEIPIRPPRAQAAQVIQCRPVFTTKHPTRHRIRTRHCSRRDDTLRACDARRVQNPRDPRHIAHAHRNQSRKRRIRRSCFLPELLFVRTEAQDCEMGEATRNADLVCARITKNTRSPCT